MYLWRWEEAISALLPALHSSQRVSTSMKISFRRLLAPLPVPQNPPVSRLTHSRLSSAVPDWSAMIIGPFCHVAGKANGEYEDWQFSQRESVWVVCAGHRFTARYHVTHKDRGVCSMVYVQTGVRSLFAVLHISVSSTLFWPTGPQRKCCYWCYLTVASTCESSQEPKLVAEPHHYVTVYVSTLCEILHHNLQLSTTVVPHFARLHWYPNTTAPMHWSQ